MQLKKVIATIAAAASLLAAGMYVGAQGADAATTDPGTAADPLVSKSYVDQFTSFRVIQVAKGQKVIAEAGAELVLRSGTATIQAQGASGGVADLTGAVDLAHGKPVPANHLLMVPRTDGRGLTATSDLFLMVKGIVSIQ